MDEEPLNEYQKGIVEKFRKGLSHERQLIEGMSDRKAYELICVINGMNKIIFPNRCPSCEKRY